MKTIYLFERGINGWASILGDWKNWPNQAIAWVHRNTPERAQTLLYFVAAPLAALTRKRRATQFAKLICQYKEDGWKIVVVAHSEGTATALKALQIAGYPKISELHLICGAVTANCKKNGLNKMLIQQAVGKVFCYVARHDMAMRIEDTILGRWFFGIRIKDKPMGLAGPIYCIAGSDKVQVVNSGRWHHFGHSTCFEPKHFEATMREIIGEPQADI